MHFLSILTANGSAYDLIAADNPETLERRNCNHQKQPHRQLSIANWALVYQRRFVLMFACVSNVVLLAIRLICVVYHSLCGLTNLSHKYASTLPAFIAVLRYVRWRRACRLRRCLRHRYRSTNGSEPIQRRRHTHVLVAKVNQPDPTVTLRTCERTLSSNLRTEQQ
jgi:hypothetical protein